MPTSGSKEPDVGTFLYNKCQFEGRNGNIKVKWQHKSRNGNIEEGAATSEEDWQHQRRSENIKGG